MTSPEEAHEQALDRCIDRLLQGDEWQTTLPVEPAARDEVSGLMAVAHKLLALARSLPPLDPGQRERVWTRARETMGRVLTVFRAAAPSRGGAPP